MFLKGDAQTKDDSGQNKKRLHVWRTLEVVEMDLLPAALSPWQLGALNLQTNTVWCGWKLRERPVSGPWDGIVEIGYFLSCLRDDVNIKVGRVPAAMADSRFKKNDVTLSTNTLKQMTRVHPWAPRMDFKILQIKRSEKEEDLLVWALSRAEVDVASF